MACSCLDAGISYSGMFVFYACIPLVCVFYEKGISKLFERVEALPTQFSVLDGEEVPDGVTYTDENGRPVHLAPEEIVLFQDEEGRPVDKEGNPLTMKQAEERKAKAIKAQEEKAEHDRLMEEGKLEDEVGHV